MSVQTQLRRGTEEEHKTFTGAVGEVTVVTTDNSLRVHNGEKAGGYETATQRWVYKTNGLSELNGGVWASGQIFNFHNEYMIYNGKAYSPLPATVLPYTVGVVPDLGFVYKIKLSSHPTLSDINAAGGHDQISNRRFTSLASLVSYTGHSVGLVYSLGESTFRVNTLKGVALSGGLFAQPLKICASDFGVDSTGATGTVAAMNALITQVQSWGGGQIDVTGGEYVIDSVAGLDAYNTGWLIPPAEGFVFGESKDPITINIQAGARIRCSTPNTIMIRASTDHVKFIGSGRIEAYGIANVIGIAYAPVNMENSTIVTSNSFGYVAPTLNMIALTYGVMTTGGPTVGGQDSGCFYHKIGFSFLHVDYPYWAKDFIHSNQNLTTRTTLSGIRGGNCISSMKIEAGEIATEDCKFENMSGEVIDFKLKGKPANILDSSLHLGETVFEVYALATKLNTFGITIGMDCKFLSPNTTIVSGTTSPINIPSRLVLGSGNGVQVQSHSMDLVVHGPSNVKTITTNLDGTTGAHTIFGTNVSYSESFIKTLYGGLELNDGTFNGYKLTHSGVYGRGIYVSANNDGFSDYIQLDGAVGANYRAKIITSAVSGVVYYETANGSVFNSTGTYGMISDHRTKENFIPARDYTADLMKLEVGTYKSLLSGDKNIGLLADEVLKVFPSLVEVTNDPVIVNGETIEDALTLKTSPLLFIMLDVIQRQEKRISALESK